MNLHERLPNAHGRGINIGCLVMTSPDVKAGRETLAARLKR